MVNYEIPIQLKGFWDKEAETVPLFEEIMRLAAMYDLPKKVACIDCPEAYMVLSHDWSFHASKVASRVVKDWWRRITSEILVEASLADWQENRVMEIQAK